MGVLLPMLPFLVLHYGGTPAVVTQLVAFYGLAAFIADPYMGWLSDRIGRINLIVLSLVGTLVAFSGMLLSTSLVTLFAFRIFGGALAGRAPVLRALVTDGVSSETQVNRISWLAAITAIGASLGPVLASVTASISPTPALQYRNTLAAAIVLNVFALLLAVAVQINGAGRGGSAAARPKPGPTVGKMRIVTLIRTPLILSVVTSYAYGVLFSMTAIFVKFRFGWGIVQTGWLLTGMAAMVAIGRMFLLPRLIKRFGSRRALALLLAIATPALLAMAFVPVPALFVVASLVFANTCALATVVPTAQVSVAAPPSDRGYALGVAAAAAALGGFVSSSLNGVLFQYVGYYVPHLLGAAAMIVGLLVLLATDAPPQPRPAPG